MRDGDPNYHALDKYYPELCGQAIVFLATGKSFAALAGELDVAESTIYDWMKKHPNFDNACKVGKAKGQAYWESQADSNMENKNYNATMYIFKMKSQYKIKDGSEPIKQDDKPQAHVLFGMEGEQHRELVEKIMTSSEKRGE